MTHSILWMIVGICATIAVYSKQIHDTLLERIALALVALVSFGASSRAWYGVYYAPSGDTSLAFAFAVYAIVIVRKHMSPEIDLPKDKCKPSLIRD